MHRLRKFIAKGNYVLGWKQFYEIYVIRLITYLSGDRKYAVYICSCKNNIQTICNFNYILVQKNNIPKFEIVMTKFENLLQ